MSTNTAIPIVARYCAVQLGLRFGGLTVAALFESLTPNYAWAQHVRKDDKDLKLGYARS